MHAFDIDAETAAGGAALVRITARRPGRGHGMDAPGRVPERGS